MTTDFTTCAFSEGAGRACGSDGGGSGLGRGEETRDQLLRREGGWRSQCRGKVGMGPAAVSGRPSAGEGEDEAAAAAGTGKERAEVKAVTEEGEGLKAGFDSHGTGAGPTLGRRGPRASCLVLSSSRAVSSRHGPRGVPSVWRAGWGQSALLAFTLREGRTCLLGARIEGPLAL